MVLWLGRWKIIGAPPDLPKYVLIGQHTSNWDFVWMLAFVSYFRIDVRWIGKDTLFRPPFGAIMRALGGIPVDRSSHHDLVTQMANELKRRDRLILGIAPEGTRKFVDHWKSGFYAIAEQAGVPIVPARLDYGKRIGGFEGVVTPSGNVRADMDQLRAFYAGQQNMNPEWTGTVRLKSEENRDP